MNLIVFLISLFIFKVDATLNGMFGNFVGPFPIPVELEHKVYFGLLSEDLESLGEQLQKNWGKISKFSYSSIPGHLSLLSGLLVGIKFFPEQNSYLEKVLGKVLEERPKEFEALFPKSQIQEILQSNIEQESELTLWTALLYFSCYLKRPMIKNNDVFVRGMNELASEYIRKWGVLLVPEILSLVQRHQNISKELEEALLNQPLLQNSEKEYFSSHPLYNTIRRSIIINNKQVQLKIQNGRILAKANDNKANGNNTELYVLTFDPQFKKWKSKRWNLRSKIIQIKAITGQIVAVADTLGIGEVLQKQVLPFLFTGTCAEELMILIDAMIRDNNFEFVWLGTVSTNSNDQ